MKAPMASIGNRFDWYTKYEAIKIDYYYLLVYRIGFMDDDSIARNTLTQLSLSFHQQIETF